MFRSRLHRQPQHAAQNTCMWQTRARQEWTTETKSRDAHIYHSNCRRTVVKAICTGAENESIDSLISIILIVSHGPRISQRGFMTPFRGAASTPRSIHPHHHHHHRYPPRMVVAHRLHQPKFPQPLSGDEPPSLLYTLEVLPTIYGVKLPRRDSDK